MTDNLAPDQDRIKAVMEIIADYGSLCFEAGTHKFADGLTHCDRAMSAIHFALEGLAGHELTRGLAATPAQYNVTARPQAIRHYLAANRVDSLPGFPPPSNPMTDPGMTWRSDALTNPVQGPGTIEIRDGDPKNAPLHVRILTEADVRRIVREEMGK